MYHRTLSNTILFQRVTRGCEVSLVVHYPSRGTAHMVQGIRIACAGTAGRVFRELEAIAASDVYHQPMIQIRRGKLY
jgi:hypothetical protein